MTERTFEKQGLNIDTLSCHFKHWGEKRNAMNWYLIKSWVRQLFEDSMSY